MKKIGFLSFAHGTLSGDAGHLGQRGAHCSMENRHGLAVAGRVTHANGTAERRASETMLKARRKAAGRRITAGEDKAYDTADHVANLRAIGVTPHVTQNQAVTKTGKTRNSAIDERTTRHPGYRMSQSRRAMVECIFGWGKQHGTMRKTNTSRSISVPAAKKCSSPATSWSTRRSNAMLKRLTRSITSLRSWELTVAPGVKEVGMMSLPDS
jgi:hypothetical protein